MRPLRYSTKFTLDGCCDHRVMIPNEDLKLVDRLELASGRWRCAMSREGRHLDTMVSRTIRFPALLRQRLALDADRCGRSFVPHE